MITFFSIGCNNSSMTKLRLVWMSDCIIQKLEDVVTYTCLNSLAPGICINNLESIILKHMLRIKFKSTACKIALRWVPQNLTNKKSTLVQVMAWCNRQQAITWANVDPDLCRHMASKGNNGLTLVDVSGVWQPWINNGGLSLPQQHYISQWECLMATANDQYKVWECQHQSDILLWKRVALTRSPTSLISINTPYTNSLRTLAPVRTSH